MEAATTAVDAFLARLESGDWRGMEEHYTPGAVFSATVPQWNFAVQGPARIAEELIKWYPNAATLRDVHVEPTSRGAVVEFERRWERFEAGDNTPEVVGVRQMHMLILDGDRIAEHHAHCAGRWDAQTFATIEAEAPKV